MGAPEPRLPDRLNQEAVSLASEWRRLGRAATAVALLTAPVCFVVLFVSLGWPVLWSLLAAIVAVVVFRGVVDVLAHKLIPSPALYGAEDELKEQDVVSRRRV